MRRCTVRSLAKINLDLRVLDKRADGFHELRTIFQTISLGDRIDIEFEPGRGTRIEIEDDLGIADNLIIRAAEALCGAARVRGRIGFRLSKNIPMGAGLGGGSSNAAAVLLALPVLAGVRVQLATLAKLAAALGSDVPFFLHGGTALGIGRGTELYPLPPPAALHGIVAAPGVHVSTPEAYAALGRGLTMPGSDPDTGEFQGIVWGLGDECLSEGWAGSCANDFEIAVFHRHPELKIIRDRLRRAGAKPALLSGSGSALFGLFETREHAAAAAAKLGRERSAKGIQYHPVSLVNRRRYQALWWRQLREHIFGKQWPPQTRY